MTNKLTEHERQQLAALLSEIKNRGLQNKLQSLKLTDTRQKRNFHVDENGYFVRRDGKKYNPTPDQKGVIDSEAQFVLMAGSRGCVSGNTKLSGIPIAELQSGNIDTFYGSSRFDLPYLKGKDNLYYLKTESGAEVEATLQHRILTPLGWRSLKELRCGSLVLTDGTLCEPKGSEKPSNYSEYCSSSFHLSGAIYNLAEQASLDILLQLHMIDDDNSAWGLNALPSIVDFLSLMLFQFFVEYSIGLISYEFCLLKLRTFFQLLYKTFQIDKVELFHSLGDYICLAEQLDLYESHKDLEYTKLLHQTDLFSSQPPLHFSFLETDHKLLSSSGVLETILQGFCDEVLVFLSSEYNQFPLLVYSQRFFDLSQNLSLIGLWNGDLDIHPPTYSDLSHSLLSAEVPTLGYMILQSYKSILLSHQNSLLWFSQESFVGFVQQLYRDLSFSLPYFTLTPIDNNYTTFEQIKSIEFSRFGDYYDLNVPDYHHYRAGGLFHHNSGKSCTGAQKALKKLSEGKSGTIANPKFEDLKKSTWVEFREWIPWDNVIPRHKYLGDIGFSPHQPFQIAFTNGAIAYLQGLNAETTGRGANNNWFWYDEGGSDPDGMAFKVTIASVRVGKEPQTWVTTTPKGKLHWLYDFFFKNEIPEKVMEMRERLGITRPLLETFAAHLEDNVVNLDPGVVTSLMTAYVEGSYLYKQEVRGEFVIEGGARGNSTWFNDHILDKPPEIVKKRVRYWDLAATEKKLTGKKLNDPDETSGTLMSWDGDLKFYIEHQENGHWEWSDIKDIIVRTAVADGMYVEIWIEQEAAAGGKNQVAELTEVIHKEVGTQWRVQGHRPEGDKIQRADIWFAEASRGQFYIMKAHWNQMFFDQLDSFPEARHDDRIDSVSGARIVIAPINPMWKSIEFIHL